MWGRQSCLRGGFRAAASRLKSRLQPGLAAPQLFPSAMALLLSALPLAAQQPLPRDNQTAKFQASSQLVVEIVSVKDKDGKVIEGLTAKDFTVTENGAPQTIRFCEYQKVEDTPDAA